MKRLTSDNKMLGYELITEVVVRETTLRSIVTDIVGTRQKM